MKVPLSGKRMEEAQDPNWYRQEAKRLRSVGERYAADERLRQSYLDLANEYDRLAAVLENGQRSYPTGAAKSHAAADPCPQ